jgi:integrase
VQGRSKVADIAVGAIEHRVRYLSDDEEKKLLAALRDRDCRIRTGRASGNEWRNARGIDLLPTFTNRFVDYLEPAVLVSMHTGLRQGELFRLTWGCVDNSSKTIMVKAANAKSGKARHVAMNGEVIEILGAWKPQGAKADDLVFVSPFGMAIASPKRAWGTLMRDAAIHNFTWHDLRHTFASKLAMKGVDLYSIKELLGHDKVTTTEIYAHLQLHRHAEAVAKLCEGVASRHKSRHT